MAAFFNLVRCFFARFTAKRLFCMVQVSRKDFDEEDEDQNKE